MKTQKFFGINAAQAKEMIEQALMSEDPIVKSRANSAKNSELNSAYFCMQQEAQKFGSLVTAINRGFEIYPLYKGQKIEAIAKRAGAQIEFCGDFPKACEVYNHFRTVFGNVETNMECQQLSEDEQNVGLKPAVKVFCEKKLREGVSLEDVANSFLTFVEDRFGKGQRPLFGYVYTREQIVKTDDEREYTESSSYIRIVADVPEGDLENWKDDASDLIYFVGVFLARRIDFNTTETILPFARPKYGEELPEGMMSCPYCGRTLAIDMQGNIRPCPCESDVREHIVPETGKQSELHPNDEGRHVC